MHWFTWIIFLSSHVLKKNIESIYVWYFDRLARFKYHVECKNYELFSKKVDFLATLSQLLVLVLFGPRLIL